MAIEKALFTSQADFKQEGMDTSVNPFLSYNADDSTGWTKVGTPGIVPGVKRNAETYATAFVQKAMTLNPGTHIFSLFIKPTTSDMTGWRIFFTNRGAGQTNRGFHLAMLDGNLDIRVYDLNGAVLDLYSFESVGKKIQADHLYHIIVEFIGTRTTVHVNDVTASTGYEQWMNSTYPMTLPSNWAQKLTIGDMPTGTSKTYAFNGWIDEFKYWNNVQGSVPTIDELKNEYFQKIMDAKWIDWWTEPGSMTVGKSQIDGTYNQDMWTWNSPVIDLGRDGFGDFGRVQVNFEKPIGTFIDIFTRTSKDQNTWNDWIKISTDGMINSPDERYMEIKVDFGTTVDNATPKIMEIQVLDYPAKKRLTLTSEPLIIYRDLDTGKERVGELVNAYDIFIIEEIIDAEGGQESIEFKMATNDPMRKRLGDEPVELIAQIGDKEFILRSALDKRDDSGKKYTEFFGESKWYELIDAKVINFEQIEKGAKDMMNAILANTIEPTGWTIYKVETDGRKRTIRGEWKSVIELMTEVADQYGGELKYDTVDRTISLVNKVGEDNGVRFYYNKNLKTIERSVDTFGMITRLYLYGANGMTIKSVHPQGQEYVENMTWVNALKLRNKIRIDRWSDGRYTIPQNLMEDGQKMVDELGKPNIAYAMTIHDLSMLSGHEHESIGLGDSIHVIDTELMNMLVSARIVRRKYNVRQPWKTEVELNQPKKTLADANKRSLDDAIQVLAESDPLDTSDVQQMTVFNHLLNSRAEDGMTYWEVSGTGITPVIGGFSGDASWEVQSGYGETNTMKQSIYGVSHRSAYTISAYVGNSGTITRGTSQDAFVGIKVRIHYTEPDTDGNTYEDHYLAIPDITQESGV